MGRQQMQPIPCNVEDITTTTTNTALGAAGQREGASGRVAVPISPYVVGCSRSHLLTNRI